MAYKVEKTDEQWREELSPEEYAVLRKAGTERAFTGEYTDTETKGVYRCKACQAKLFESDTKFHSGLRLAVLLPAARRHGRVHRGQLARA